jgi:hypothetical protein
MFEIFPMRIYIAVFSKVYPISIWHGLHCPRRPQALRLFHHPAITSPSTSTSRRRRITPARLNSFHYTILLPLLLIIFLLLNVGLEIGDGAAIGAQEVGPSVSV